MMRTAFLDIESLATFDADQTQLTRAYVLVDDHRIQEVGQELPRARRQELLAEGWEIIDGSGKLMLPGFVNTHHHLYQSMFRNVRGAQNLRLFDWLVFLYERWKHIDPDAVFFSSLVGIYEMMLSGVTTTTDMFYLFPKGTMQLFDVEIEAGKRTGVRFHPCRGSMSLSRKDGGLPPDSVVQTQDEILEDCIRVIGRYHDPSPLSMLQIALAPCSPFSVTKELMHETREMAERFDLLIHTHLAETKDEEAYCLEQVGMKPVAYMDHLGWLNKRAWFAHCVWMGLDEIQLFDRHQVGVAHCPTSNMRLGSGCAPIAEMLCHPQIRLGLAVDGSASNDTGNMLHEIRNTLLLQRVFKGADAVTPYQALEMATMGGARVLRRDAELGSIEPGKAADLILFDLNRLEFAGGLSDPLSAVVMCDAKGVDLSMIHGEIRVRDGQIVDEEMGWIIQHQNRLAQSMLDRG